jgi:hypothetical protein
MRRAFLQIDGAVNRATVLRRLLSDQMKDRTANLFGGKS